MDLKWSNGINYKDLFLSLVKYATNNSDIAIASKFEKITKLFKSGDNDVYTFEKVLNKLHANNKMIDLVGRGDSSDLYYAEDIKEMLDDDLKKLPTLISDDYLIVNFEDNHGLDRKPMGIKVFKICDYDSEENQKEDMVRRSKYV